MPKFPKFEKKSFTDALNASVHVQAYLQTGTYAKDDVISHPSFGKGLVEHSQGNKINVRFEDKLRTLITKGHA